MSISGNGEKKKTMTLQDVFDSINDTVNIKLFDEDGTLLAVYDGRNSIPEMYNNCFVTDSEFQTPETMTVNINLKWDDLKKSSPLCAGDFIPSTLVTDKLYFIDVRDEADVRIVNTVLDDWDSNGGRMTKDYIGKTVIIVLGYDDDGEKREFSEFYGTIDECVRNFRRDLEKNATTSC